MVNQVVSTTLALSLGCRPVARDTTFPSLFALPLQFMVKKKINKIARRFIFLLVNLAKARVIITIDRNYGCGVVIKNK